MVNVAEFNFSQMRVLHQPPAPAYPPDAKADHIQGVVVVEVLIDPTGIPKWAAALEGPPALQGASLQYALDWRFKPQKINGVPQPARFKLTMPFHLR